MKRILALIYRSKQAKNLENPYSKALMTIIGPAITLLLLICAAVKVYPFGRLASPYRVIIVGAILFLFFKLFSFACKEEDLTKYEFNDAELKKATTYVSLCNTAMFIFVLIALILIVIRPFSLLTS